MNYSEFSEQSKIFLKYYCRCSCLNVCISTKFGKKWIKARTSVLSMVDTPAFEWMVLVLIFASSATLCFEDIYLDDNLFLKNILYWTNLGFCTLFSIEMVLKWLALGFCKYFTSFWTILDFIIAFVSNQQKSVSRYKYLFYIIYFTYNCFKTFH